MLANPPGPVSGSTALPAGFSHPHSSEEARAIAENGMIVHRSYLDFWARL